VTQGPQLGNQALLEVVTGVVTAHGDSGHGSMLIVAQDEADAKKGFPPDTAGP
jgi:hypothetical protein